METELIPLQINVYDKDIGGCKRMDKDIMIGLTLNAKDHPRTSFVDIFLTEDLAWRLVDDLLKTLHTNKELLKQENNANQ